MIAAVIDDDGLKQFIVNPRAQAILPNLLIGRKYLARNAEENEGNEQEKEEREREIEGKENEKEKEEEGNDDGKGMQKFVVLMYNGSDLLHQQ